MWWGGWWLWGEFVGDLLSLDFAFYWSLAGGTIGMLDWAILDVERALPKQSHATRCVAPIAAPPVLQKIAQLNLHPLTSQKSSQKMPPPKQYPATPPPAILQNPYTLNSATPTTTIQSGTRRPLSITRNPQNNQRHASHTLQFILRQANGMTYDYCTVSEISGARCILGRLVFPNAYLDLH